MLAWVADVDDGSFGFDPHPGAGAEDVCRVVLTFADGNAPATVRFGAEGEGGIYGKVDGRPEVFVAPRSLFELAQRIYVNHGALRAEPASIEAVKVTSGGKLVTDRDGASSEALRAAVGALFADRVAALGTTDVGPVDVDIAIVLADAGAAKRVFCSAPQESPRGPRRRCATPGVKAVFEVRQDVVDAFVRRPADASTPDAR